MNIIKYKQKVKKLEDRIYTLRLGRRILMDLLIDQENKKNKEIQKLTQEINRLNNLLRNQ
ncbi:MAG TPA: hypothetical protein GX723_07065 [Thermoanaerobacterales bacterium]|nr:hypothetical protein [Thermoanaerobacterales bacterium]